MVDKFPVDNPLQHKTDDSSQQPTADEAQPATEPMGVIQKPERPEPEPSQALPDAEPRGGDEADVGLSQVPDEAAVQNAVPANFVEIWQIEEPAPAEKEVADLVAAPDDQEAENEAIDRGDPEWLAEQQSIKEEIEKLRAAEEKARQEMCKAVGPTLSPMFNDLQAKWQSALEKFQAKERELERCKAEKAAEEGLSGDEDFEDCVIGEEVASAERAEPKPDLRFGFTVGGKPGKAAGLSAMQELIKVEGGGIAAFGFTATEDGVIDVWERANPDWNAFFSKTKNKARSVYREELTDLLCQSLLLPGCLEGFRTTRELFDSIVTLLQKYTLLSRKECSMLAYWSFATWFADVLPLVPSLVICGPASVADLLFRTLAPVCRRPLLLADLSPAALRRIPVDQLKPTLFIRQPQSRKQTAALLDASSQPGYLFFNGQDFQQLYCAKCIYVGDHIKEQPIATNTVAVNVEGTLLRPLHSVPTEAEIGGFQNQFLAYRFLGRNKVATSNFRVSGFRTELCSVAEVLGAAIVDDPELQRGIIEVLKGYDEQMRTERASGLKGVVLRAVLSHCHQKDQDKLFVREIATTVNGIYHEEGESLKVSNEKVGHVLKHLGLFTSRLDNSGRGLVLDRPTRSQAHRLGYSYDVLDFENACANCHELQLSQSEELVQDV